MIDLRNQLFQKFRSKRWLIGVKSTAKLILSIYPSVSREYLKSNRPRLICLSIRNCLLREAAVSGRGPFWTMVNRSSRQSRVASCRLSPRVSRLWGRLQSWPGKYRLCITIDLPGNYGVDGERADKAGWLYVVAGRGGETGTRWGKSEIASGQHPICCPFRNQVICSTPVRVEWESASSRELSCASLRVIGTIVNARKTCGIMCSRPWYFLSTPRRRDRRECSIVVPRWVIIRCGIFKKVKFN